MSDESNPATPSGAAKRQQRANTITRDAYGGALAIQAKAQDYLPVFEREEVKDYADRLATSIFYDAYTRTIDGLTGMVFRKSPKLAENLPPDIVTWWENIDLHGTHGDVFFQERHRDGEVDGHFLVFVDMQTAPDAETKAEESQANLRPYCVPIEKRQVRAARMASVGGVPMLGHFRYCTTAVVVDGYAEKEVEQVREYNLTTNESGRFVQFTLHEQQKIDGRDVWVEVESFPMSIDEIPVAVAYHGHKLGPFETRPPHLSLALENIKLYQLVSDNDNVLHLCSVPIYHRIGAEAGDTQEVSPHTGVDLPLGGDAKYVEPEGNGLEEARLRIEKSEHRCAVLGLSNLMGVKANPETATAEKIDKAEGDSVLANHARATQDAMEEVVRLMAKWKDLELPAKDKDARWVTLDRSFDALTLDAQMVSALDGAVAKGNLSAETMWSLLVRGGVLPDSFDEKAERQRIEEAGMNEILRIAERMKQTRPVENEPALEDAA